MAKTRLNMHHRDLLSTFARTNIVCPKEDAANKKAYDKAASLVRAEAEKKFPPADMKVLAKYKAAGPDQCVNGGSPSGAFTRFQFTVEEDAPILPQSYCSSRSISFSQKTCDAIDAYEKAKDALDKAQALKIENYRSLIRSARNFEEIVEVWPAAAALSDKISAPATALVTLSDDVRAFIQADNAGEQLAA